MQEDFMDSAIAETIDSAQPQTDATPTEETPITEATEPEAPETEAREEAFPKKAVNAISRRDKQIGKLRAQYEQVQSELSKLRAEAVQPQAATSAPKESDFTNYADFLRAQNVYEIEQRFAERDKKVQETQSVDQEKRWVSERQAYLDRKAEEFAKEIPEINSLIEEYSDVIQEFSPNLKRLFLEADDAPLALFNLVKEGKLEELGSMSLARAAMEIGRAQALALPTKPKTNAPKPLPAARGSVAASKNPSDMTPEEAYDLWFKS